MKPIPTRVRRQFDERADAVLPGLSPDFLSADDAARYVHALIDHTHAKECGGLILKAEDGKYVATLPFFTETDEYNPYRLLPVDETGKLSHPPALSAMPFIIRIPMTMSPAPRRMTCVK